MRKEDRGKEILAKRGEQSGLVCIFSAMEPCSTYKPWHDKQSGKTYLRPDDGKCLHYYFYFLDDELGLCYVRVPTWLPCRLQIYCNGHNWLAARLRKQKISYNLVDYEFQGPTTVKPGKILFKAANLGSEHHELEVLDKDGEALGEIEAFDPKATAAPLALELDKGTYTLQCILETKDGKTHKSLGMVQTLTVE